MSTREAMSGLSTHDLLVQLFRAKEELLVAGGSLDAEACAQIVEEVLALVDDRSGD